MLKNELALIAGIVASDGHLERDGCGVKVISTSSAFTFGVVVPLLKRYVPKVSVYTGKTGFSRKRKFIAYVYSKGLSEALSRQYRIPKGKKALSMKAPRMLGLSERLGYLRGWFAGEGCVSRDIHKENGNRYVCPEIELWVKNKHIANWIYGSLLVYGINAKLFRSKKRKQFLVIVRERKSVFLFAEKIGFVHPEKQEKLKTILRGLSMPQNQNVARQFGGIS